MFVWWAILTQQLFLWNWNYKFKPPICSGLDHYFIWFPLTPWSFNRTTRKTEQAVSVRVSERTNTSKERLLAAGCRTSQQHASVSQGLICSDNCMCCRADIEVAAQIFWVSHTFTVYWQWANQSQHLPYNARHLAGFVCWLVACLLSVPVTW